MKSNTVTRPIFNSEDSTRRANKLTPNKKSGKERHNLYSHIEEDQDEELDLSYKKKESVFDYFDDQQEE